MKEYFFNTVQQFNDAFGFETLHPMVSVVRNECDTVSLEGWHTYGLYALFLKENKGCMLSYGRTKYDYEEMTIVSFSPGQRVQVKSNPDIPVAKWTAIVFHPDFLIRTSLGKEMSKYGFFSYNSNEALHLSSSEVRTLRTILDIIQQEMTHTADRHSKQIIVNNMEVFLNYCLRFYERQFVMRKEINHDVVARFDHLLDEYLQNKAANEGIPTVSYFADQCCLSPGYFGELIKVETGSTAQDYISERVLTRSKELLNDFSLNVMQVGQRLGFDYPQHFVRFFKRHTGVTPSKFREISS